MIIGLKSNLEAYKGISANIDKAIAFLSTVSADIPCGRHEIDGDDLYANVIEGKTSPLQEPVFEAHNRYIDLQLVLKGSETIVYADVSDCEATTEYDAENDYCLLKGSGTVITVPAGSFYMAHPFDAHSVGNGDGSDFKKIVVKISR